MTFETHVTAGNDQKHNRWEPFTRITRVKSKTFVCFIIYFIRSKLSIFSAHATGSAFSEAHRNTYGHVAVLCSVLGYFDLIGNVPGCGRDRFGCFEIHTW